MIYFRLLILFVFGVSCAQISKAQDCVDPDLEITGQPELNKPWPAALGHPDRHTEVQKAVAYRKKSFLRCRKQYGELHNKVHFHVDINGEITVDEGELSNAAEECYAIHLQQVRVGEYSCEFPFDYAWDGQFPIVNQYRRQFPK